MKHLLFSSFRLVALVACFAGLAAGLRAQSLSTLTNGQVSVAYTFTITSTPAAPAGTVYAATGLPTGLSINASSGTISGTPTVAGTTTGTISLTSGSTTNNFNYQITIAPAAAAPAITSSTSVSGTVGTALTYTITATNTPTSYNLGVLPGGLSYNGNLASPKITGTPTAAGTFTASISATNGSGTGTAITVTFTIAAAASAPVITSGTSASIGGAAPFAINYQITASNSPTSFSASGLPVGATFDSTVGLISGSSSVAGTYTVALSATNGSGTGPTTNLTLTLGLVSSISSASSFSGTVGAALNFQLGATNAPVSFNASGLPTGLTINATTGAISGTPTAAGTYTLTVSANNAVGTGPSSTVTLTVAAATSGGGGGGGGGGVVSNGPTISSQPVSQAVASGATATFSITASGTGTITYQWNFNGAPISGATSSTLTLTNVQSSNVGIYSATATNAGGSTSSTSASLTLLVVPVSITTQPVAQTAAVGATVSFTVVAAGSPTPTYQWRLNGNALAGATSATLVLTNVQSSNAGPYSVVVTNSSNSVTSASASLTVNTPLGLVITAQPNSLTVGANASATFSVAAIGATGYQWNFNGNALSGATGSSYTVSSATSANVGSYTVTVSNANGSATSNGAILAVEAAGSPILASQPRSQTISVGSTVILSVTPSGAVTTSNTEPNFGIRPEASTVTTYQWYVNGIAISGATTPTLVLSNVSSTSSGTYYCVVTNSSGSILSNPAVITVTATADPGRLINLSVNTTAGKSQVLTVGLVTGGAGTSGAQSLLIRATGPALAASFGIANTLADPTLTVLAGQTTVASNDNWGSPATNQSAVTAADSATFAFPLTTPTSLDAALATSLATVVGGYTVQVSGNTAASGTVLAEVYDNTPSGTYTASTPRLINISANNLIAAKGSMTAGFSIGGSTSKTVLIRATGPALAGLGVSGTMPDPQLILHTTVSGSDSILATNAGWGGSAQITAASNAVNAFALTNPSSADSVILITLPPGLYTAVASSVSGTAGIALIEVYEVP